MSSRPLTSISEAIAIVPLVKIENGSLWHNSIGINLSHTHVITALDTIEIARRSHNFTVGRQL
jgi:hypothetical protein